jgi:hypothetical protein
MMKTFFKFFFLLNFFFLFNFRVHVKVRFKIFQSNIFGGSTIVNSNFIIMISVSLSIKAIPEVV